MKLEQLDKKNDRSERKLLKWASSKNKSWLD